MESGSIRPHIDCILTLLAHSAKNQPAAVSEWHSGYTTEGVQGRPISNSNFRMRPTAEEMLLTVAAELLE